jgi:hypothetical protein
MQINRILALVFLRMLKYQHKMVTGNFVLTLSATAEKLEMMRNMSSHLSLRAK